VRAIEDDERFAAPLRSAATLILPRISLIE
jgi:hypothetical protein